MNDRKGATTLKYLAYYVLLHDVVDVVERDARNVAAIISQHVPATLQVTDKPERVRLGAGAIAQLRRLFDRVERGDMSAEEATRNALRVLSRNADPDEQALIRPLADHLL